MAFAVLPCIRISSVQTSARGKDQVLASRFKVSGMAGSRRKSKITRRTLRRAALVSAA